MNKRLILTILIIISAIVLLPQAVVASNGDSRTITLHKCSNENTEHSNEDVFIGTRIPTKPITCIMTQTTVEIPNMDIKDIISFEIYSIDGRMLNVFSSQEAFCNFIFTHQDELEIRLITSDFILKGFI